MDYDYTPAVVARYLATQGLEEEVKKQKKLNPEEKMQKIAEQVYFLDLQLRGIMPEEAYALGYVRQEKYKPKRFSTSRMQKYLTDYLVKGSREEYLFLLARGASETGEPMGTGFTDIKLKALYRVYVKGDATAHRRYSQI